MSENETTCPVCRQALPATGLKGATLIWLRQHRVSQANANQQTATELTKAQSFESAATNENPAKAWVGGVLIRGPKTLERGVAKLVCIDHAIECVHQAQSPGED